MQWPVSMGVTLLQVTPTACRQCRKRGSTKTSSMLNQILNQISILPDSLEAICAKVIPSTSTLVRNRIAFKNLIVNCNFSQRKCSASTLMHLLLIGIGIPKHLGFFFCGAQKSDS